MSDWQSILAEHGAAVWRTAYRLLNHHADAADCYQETFLAAWRFAARAPVADWRSFLVSLATRRAVDSLRQRLRRRRHQAQLDAAAEPATEAGDPSQQARASELMTLVREGMARLPDKQAEAFWLSCVEGLSHQQISAQMGVAPGQVRVLLHRARASLARALAPKLLDERERT
jgi:RNA polymerase sigma-70 factor (ECF subfamily)